RTGVTTPRRAVDHADSAQRVPLLVDQRDPRVKPDVWFRHHEWIISESFIVQGIRYDKNVGLLNGRSAKSNFARSFRNGDSDFRLKPLPTFINERDQRNRRLADEGGQQNQIIKGLLRLCVEDSVSMESRNPGCFALYRRGGGPLLCPTGYTFIRRARSLS